MNLSPIESINHDVFGEILVGLNHVTGTLELINPKDIPYIYKYARNLACTSKKMNSFFNEEMPTQVFLDSMAARFGQPFKEFASEFNTRGSLKCLWTYIQKKGLDKDYAEIYKIYSLAKDMLMEVEKSLSPKFNKSVTESGFIQLGGRGSKTYLATPFGEISFTGGLDETTGREFLNKFEEEFRRPIITTPDENFYKVSSPGAMWRVLEANKLGKDPFMPIERVPESLLERMEPLFKKITEFVPWVIKHLDKLVDQPRVLDKRFLAVEMSENQSKIIVLLNDSAKKVLGHRGWLLCYKDKRLVLTYNHKACLLLDLARTYEEILKNLTAAWAPVTLRDFPDIQPLVSEEEFQLFKNKGSEVDKLLLHIIKEFGLGEDIWLQGRGLSIFYWVRKKKAIEDSGLFKPGSLVSNFSMPKTKF